MNVPQLRFSGFGGEWKETFVKDTFSEVRNGFVGTATPFYVEKGIPYLQSNNVKNNKINKKKMIYINEEFHKKNKKSILRRNDIVMVQSGHAGECAVIEEEFVGANCHALIVMTPNAYTNAHFFSYYINSPLGQKKLYKLITGNTIRHILASDIKKYDIKMPDKEEQLKISSFLALIEGRIEMQQEKIEKLGQFKKGMMQKILSQELRFKDEDGGEFPKWEETLFGEVVTNKSEKLNPKKETIILPCIELENIEQGTGQLIGNIGNSDQQSMKNKFDKESVLFGKLRPYLKKYLYTNFDGLCSTEIWVLNSKDTRLINGLIYFFVQGTEFLEAANKSIGSKMPRADWNSVSELPFKIPTIKEQEKIVDYLKALENKIVKEKEKLMVLEEQKRGFMWGMFV